MIARAALRGLIVGAAIGIVWARLGAQPAAMLASGFTLGALWSDWRWRA